MAQIYIKRTLEPVIKKAAAEMYPHPVIFDEIQNG